MKKKIKKSVLKRFKVTKTGKVMFEHQNSKGHLRRNKSRKQKRRLGVRGEMKGEFAKKIKQMLGVN
jgi:ribosomal protein L35